ncbi:hypothetical protein [Streptomyces griseofuscus]|uniref:hypothetical protein n=1 Tax=Streptomyces griseofuscus TaxID=146922 RepID=UPI0038021308
MSFGPPPSVYTQSALAADRSRGRRRRRLLGAIAAAVAIVLCVGGGLLWYHSAGDGKGRTDAKPARQSPDEVRDNRLNTERAPVSPEGQTVVRHDEDLAKGVTRHSPGVWATDKIVARAVANRITGYKIGNTLDPDNTAWTLRRQP